jgi:hypothetical protein
MKKGKEMKERVLAAILLAMIPGVVFAIVAQEFGKMAKDLPAVSPVSICYSFDTPQERYRFMRNTGMLAALFFGCVVFGALCSVSWFHGRRSKHKSDRNFVPQQYPEQTNGRT